MRLKANHKFKDAADPGVKDLRIQKVMERLGVHSTSRPSPLYSLVHCILTVLFRHELAYVLEFRSIRGGQLRPDNEPFEAPPGVTCCEAGTSWGTRAFGGRVYPICEDKNSLEHLRFVHQKRHMELQNNESK
jgi:hypothetical protein